MTDKYIRWELPMLSTDAPLSSVDLAQKGTKNIVSFITKATTGNQKFVNWFLSPEIHKFANNTQYI